MLNPGTKAKLSSAKVATNKTSSMSRSPVRASHTRIDPQHLGWFAAQTNACDGNHDVCCSCITKEGWCSQRLACFAQSWRRLQVIIRARWLEPKGPAVQPVQRELADK